MTVAPRSYVRRQYNPRKPRAITEAQRRSSRLEFKRQLAEGENATDDDMENQDQFLGEIHDEDDSSCIRRRRRRRRRRRFHAVTAESQQLAQVNLTGSSKKRCGRQELPQDVCTGNMVPLSDGTPSSRMLPAAFAGSFSSVTTSTVAPQSVVSSTVASQPFTQDTVAPQSVAAATEIVAKQEGDLQQPAGVLMVPLFSKVSADGSTSELTLAAGSSPLVVVQSNALHGLFHQVPWLAAEMMQTASAGGSSGVFNQSAASLQLEDSITGVPTVSAATSVAREEFTVIKPDPSS